MNKPKTDLEERLNIDERYLSFLNNLESTEYYTRLMNDLKSVSGGKVFLKPPHNPQLFSLYKDVRARVYGQSKTFRYTVMLYSKSDEKPLFSIIGESHVEGSYKKGYKFKYA